MTSAIRCYPHPSPLRSPSTAIINLRRRSPIFRCSGDRKVLFNRIAPIYDNLNDLLSLGQHRVWKRMAVSWSGAKKGDRVLDICCGSGDLSFILSEKVGGNGQVIGFDFSSEQLVIASSRQRQSSNSCYRNIEWVEGNALNLPFPDGYFDSITMGYGLRNVIDREKAMKEVFRVLRPGNVGFGFKFLNIECHAPVFPSGCRASILDFNKSNQPITTLFQEWMIDNVVTPVATGYGLAEEYEYLKTSIRDYLTGKELEQLARMAGFSNVRFYEIAGGLMGNLVATH